jgi:L-fuconolactonase
MNGMNLDRRQFVLGAVGAAAAAMACSGAAEPPRDPIIDTHQHLWDLKRFKLPWLANAGERLNRSYLMADYAKAIEGLNVSKAVYMEIGAAAEQKETEAREVVELCRSGNGPTVAAVIGGGVASDGFAAYIGQFKGSRYVKGVRDPYPRGGFENEKLLAGVRLLGGLGMSFDILAGSDLLPEAAKLVQACPRTRFILDHCGNPDVKWFLRNVGRTRRRSGGGGLGKRGWRGWQSRRMSSARFRASRRAERMGR